MAATAGHRLTLDPMGKIFKCLLLRNYKYYSCGGSHLGFPIGIKSRGPSNDYSWAVWFQRRSALKHVKQFQDDYLCRT
jgi:hypothetical protein